MLKIFTQWLTQYGLNLYWSQVITASIAIISIVILSFIANYVAKRIILKGLSRLIERSATKWDDILLKKKVLNNLAHLVPALVIYTLVPLALADFQQMAFLVTSAVIIYMIIVFILAINSFLDAAADIYQGYEISRQIPIRGFNQILKLAVYSVGGIFIAAIVLGKSPLYLLSGIGAITAILMVIFKDAILGFVAGIQLTANKMVALGDWIEMPKYGADGEVLDVALTTVKVQNWDKTITTIPTYALISESFKNWRGMQDSGGRRIKRSIHIDMNSIKFCTEEMLQRFYKIQYITEHVKRKRKELAEYNKGQHVDDSSLVNGRRLTNIGIFRAYLQAYLQNHPMIHQNMTFLVRQLALSEYGLPIEIYVFSKDIVWANYEEIQADIFDHILAVIPEFDLGIFQNPSGYNFQTLVENAIVKR